jgi:hypothetical protein
MNIKIILKNPLFIFLFIFAFILIGVGIFLNFSDSQKSIKPQTLPKATFAPQAIDLKLRYSYVGQLPIFENQFLIYQLLPENNLENQIEKVASQFGFSQSPQILKGVDFTSYVFNKDDESLTINSKPFSIEYNNYLQSSSDKLNRQVLENAAQIFIQNIVLGDNFSYGAPYIQLMTTDFQGILMPTNSPENAQFAQISYNYLIDEIPVIDKGRQDYPIQILLNLDGSIKKATITLPPQNLEKIGQAKLTDPQEALNAINAGQGIISHLNNPQQAYTRVEPGDISRANLNSLEVIYLYDYDNLTLQPYYRFSGSGRTNDGDLIEIAVLITALPQEVYKK